MKSRSMFIPVLLFLFAGVRAQDLPVPEYTPKPFQVHGVIKPLINLNGEWSFCSAPKNGFWKSVNPSQIAWSPIHVPGEWLMQGFTVATNTRVAYWKKVEIPADWKGNTILLKCDGLYSDAVVYVNGKSAGTHEGGFTPAEFDVTALMHPGKSNDLIIGLISESLADTLASATQYAAHQLGGITRKIEIFAVPEVHLSQIGVSTDFDDQFLNADVNIDLEVLKTHKELPEKSSVEVVLSPASGTDSNIITKSFFLDWPSGSMVLRKKLNMRIGNPVKWDPEHPCLYTMEVRLLEDGNCNEIIRQKIGFREIMVAGNQVFVNGHPIKLLGVNRHEVHPTKGRSLSMDEWKADARLFKEANVNYIRTSHYPPAEEFISLCDSVGFFVECESPLCWVGHGANLHWKNANPHDIKLLTMIRREVLETVAQYRNHPSILIWSMANESTWGPIWATILAELNSLDPTRPVSFHDQAYGGYNNAGSKDCQIAVIHYPGPGGPDIARKFDRPLLFGEYCHLNCYNRQEIVADPGVRDDWGRGLEPMVENMYHSQGCLGGAIWSGIDDAFYLPSGKLVGYGEWGPIDGWRRPKPEYWHMKKTYSPVKIAVNNLLLPKPGQAIRIPVENRYLFTNLNEVSFRWKLGDQQGSTTLWAEPGETGILVISPSKTPSDGDQLEISIISPQNYIVDLYKINLGKLPPEVGSLHRNKYVPELVDQGTQVLIKTVTNEIVINSITGRMTSLTLSGHKIPVDGPDLQMLPLTTGPCDTEHSLDIQPLNNTCANWKGQISGSGTDKSGPWIKVEGTYDEADITLTYRQDSLGKIKIEYQLICKANIDPRQIGLVFGISREYELLSWDRFAQWSVYPDDHIGRSAGWAKPFPNANSSSLKFGVKPDWPWSSDQTPMGSNDFRATREKIKWAELANENNQGIRIESDGSHAVRAWVGNDLIHVLVASFFTGGGDLFFASHHLKERKPLKKGDSFNGSVTLSEF
jgi:beta-galactosidase